MRVFSPYPSSHQASSEQIRERTGGAPNIFMRAQRSLLPQCLAKQPPSPSAVPSSLSPSLVKPHAGPRPSQVPKSRGEVNPHQSFLPPSSLPSPGTAGRPPSRSSPARPSLPPSAIPHPSPVSSVPPSVASSVPPAPARPSPARSPSSLIRHPIRSPRPSSLASSCASPPPASVPLASPRPSPSPHTSSSPPSASRSHQLPRVITSSLGSSGHKTSPHAEEDEDVIVCLHQEPPQQHSQVFRGGGGGETRAVLLRGPAGASPNFHRHSSSLPSPLSLSQNGLSKDPSSTPTTTAKAITPTSHVQPASLPACSPALSNPSEKKPLSSSLSSTTLRRSEAPREERSQGTPGVSFTATESSSRANPPGPAGLSQSSPGKNTATASLASPNKLTGVQDDEGGKGKGGVEEEESLTTTSSSSSKKLREQRQGGGVPRKRKLDGSQASSATASRNLPLLLLLQGGRFGGGDHCSSLGSSAGFSPPGATNRREEETNSSGTPSTSSSPPSVPSRNNNDNNTPAAPAHSPSSSSSTPQPSSDSPPLEGQCEVFEGEEGMDVRFTVRALQSNLKCRLCGGFFREAVTIKDCLHTFCKWCLFIRAARQDLEETGCPRCEEKLRHSLPHTNGKKTGPGQDSSMCLHTTSRAESDPAPSFHYQVYRHRRG